MQTARFAKVVAEAGRPLLHLRLVPLTKDTVLQKAERTNRVLTIHQPTVGTRTDYGTVGLSDDTSAQVLIFPHSLQAFEGKRIIGIDYTLFSDEPTLTPPKPKVRATASKPSQPSRPKAAAKPPKAEKPKPKPEPAPETPPLKTTKPKEPAKPAPANVVEFQAKASKATPEEGSDLPEPIRDQIRKAMAELEQGKHVAAYRLLSQIVGD